METKVIVIFTIFYIILMWSSMLPKAKSFVERMYSKTHKDSVMDHETKLQTTVLSSCGECGLYCLRLASCVSFDCPSVLSTAGMVQCDFHSTLATRTMIGKDGYDHFDMVSVKDRIFG